MPRREQEAVRGLKRRPRPSRPRRQRFLIVCEGEKTEPAYFDTYKAYARTVGAAGDPMGVVEKADELVDKARKAEGVRKPYDQIWCVFDRDDVPAQQFNLAISEARRMGFKVAYSNQAFELWYMLHFSYVNTAISRADYVTKLGKLVPGGYAKNRPGLAAVLSDSQDRAIQNAETLLAEYKIPHPAQDDPSTTVHLLVKALNQFKV